MSQQADARLSFLKPTAQIVAAFVGKNQVQVAEIPDLIASVLNSLTGANAPRSEPAAEERLVPAVTIRKSVTDDFIFCLEDGKKFRSLKRHLMTHYQMTPEDYREKWKLPADYPMVAPSYAAARSRMAKALGLGSEHRRLAVKAKVVQALSTPDVGGKSSKRRAPRKEVA